MTKRDIADIVLIGMGLYFFLQFVQSSIQIFYYLTSADVQYVHRAQGVAFSLIYSGSLLFLSYMLLLKRSPILDRVLTDRGDVSVVIPVEYGAIASYCFWIRLLGVVMFLVSAVQFLSYLSVEIAIKQGIALGSFHMIRTAQALVSAILSLWIVWKAQWIECIVLKRKGAQQETGGDS